MRYLSMSVLWFGVLAAAPVAAQQFEVAVQIPQLEVAEYHRPYVAAWIEDSDRQVAAHLMVWYQQDRKGGGAGPEVGNAERGTKWLPDLRQWWRRGGRALEMPMDGVSGATRAVGDHQVRFVPGEGALPAFTAGTYTLRVEAAREEGGRELLEIPFAWPPAAAQTLTAEGHSELGTLSLRFAP
ncbi:DUF2271 domain-containing protein [Sinimarinibacterium sp. CAU 1509]|uniref:DUF2271 domain-containing protein n=1 Tax=Sinimarinibacterium sp. CAU 1509 TaxID=2562283 RepID=UPI0010AD830A|nr:DUF2271 domain-containing protein [Sinimarinibacterium sp. CAU 1509]TJY56599.1 DUF2271 domain-containing protein [Sinimarinibacterium sp. CAU 1509]